MDFLTIFDHSRPFPTTKVTIPGHSRPFPTIPLDKPKTMNFDDFELSGTLAGRRSGGGILPFEHRHGQNGHFTSTRVEQRRLPAADLHFLTLLNDA